MKSNYLDVGKDNPKYLTLEDIKDILWIKGKSVGCSSSEYGSGQTVCWGEKIEGRDVIEIILYKKVANLKKEKFFKKKLPTVVVKGERWVSSRFGL